MLPALLLAAMPAVVLSEGHQAMSRVAVGDVFPAVAGLAEAQGPKATVVAATGGAAWMDKMLASDLADDFAPKYGDQGAAFVLLSGESPNAKVPSLGAAAGQITEALGPGRMPRVYVLDAAGKVVWFDLEYSLSTHRELHEALDELTAD